jgi:hypothetical protein
MNQIEIILIMVILFLLLIILHNHVKKHYNRHWRYYWYPLLNWRGISSSSGYYYNPRRDRKRRKNSGKNTRKYPRSQQSHQIYLAGHGQGHTGGGFVGRRGRGGNR